MKTNDSVEKLIENKNLFHYKTSEEDGAKDIFIDLTTILSFYIDSSYDEITLVVKMLNDSKAKYIFTEEANYERFVKEYGIFVESRNSLQYVSDQMLGQIVSVLREDIERSTSVAIEGAISNIQEAFVEEVSRFKDSVKEQADLITNTALKHQVEINKENEQILSTLGNMVAKSDQAIEQFDSFSGRINSFVSALDLIAPQSVNEAKENELNVSKLNKETESA